MSSATDTLTICRWFYNFILIKLVQHTTQYKLVVTQARDTSVTITRAQVLVIKLQVLNKYESGHTYRFK